MDCPFCHQETRVLESRLVDNSVRRRRECLSCSNRFTTYEEPFFQLIVTKKDGREQPFESEKIVKSLEKACGKADQQPLLDMYQRIERKLLGKKKQKISSKEIGKAVLQELKKFDKMAYIRFATIHKSMEDPKELKREVNFLSS